MENSEIALIAHYLIGICPSLLITTQVAKENKDATSVDVWVISIFWPVFFFAFILALPFIKLKK